MKKRRKGKFFGALLMALAIIAIVPTMASAHCDTMDGPVVKDAENAIETNNPNYIYKWVQPGDEEQISQIFKLSMKVRKLSPEAQKLADNYLIENFVRIHRAGEGEPYTGVKPHGIPIDEKIAAADKSIEVGNLTPLKSLVPEKMMPELQERLNKVLSLKDYDVNDVNAAREYVESYVGFFHFAEGEEEVHHANSEVQDSEHASTPVAQKDQDKSDEKGAQSLPLIPWSLAAILFVTTLIFAVAFHKEHLKR